MSNTLSITQYTPDHRDKCAELFNKLYSAPPFDYNWLDFDKAKQYLMDLENTPNSLSYVLTDNNVIIGACLGQKEEHFMNPGYKINEFFIEPEHQHMGLGSFFVTVLEERLREMDMKTISLFTQRHMDSYSFYQKNDFVPNNETVHMVRIIRQEPTVVYARTFLSSEN